MRQFSPSFSVVPLRAFFTALTAIAAAVSGLVALTAIRDARAERSGRSFAEWARERQRAVEDLGAALVDMAAKLEGATAPNSRHAYALATMHAEHALNLALHPDIEATSMSATPIAFTAES